MDLQELRMSGIEETIRTIVREELAKAGASPANGHVQPLLMSVPVAAEMTGIGADTIRAWIAQGKLPRRTKSALATAKRVTFLVNVDEVRAVAEGRVIRR
jgi:hypothetical protein